MKERKLKKERKPQRCGKGDQQGYLKKKGKN